ncbi:MAG: hypothetical protein U0790_28120 [Isosphaeraceae bacterium]
MGKSQLGPLPSDLARGRSQFQAWRGRRDGRGRIPHALWAVAVRLAKVHGVARTAEVLGLDHDRLKTRAEAVGEAPRSSGPIFVELPPPIVGKTGHFEFDDGAGGTMRVHLVGYDAADVEALARGFWGNR